MGHMFCRPKTPPKGEKCVHSLRIMRSPIILIIGKPRSGKSSIVQGLKTRYKLCHIDFLRLVQEEVWAGSVIGHIMEDTVLAEKSLVPRIIALELIKRVMCQRIFQASGFILEGYPRDLQQALDLEEYIAKFSMIIYLEVPQKVALPRVLKQLPGKGYPSFDTEAMLFRLSCFEMRTNPMLEHYKDILVTLNGVKSRKDIYMQVLDSVDEMFGKLGIPVMSEII